MEYFILVSIEDLQTMGYLQYPSEDLPDDEYIEGERDYYARQIKLSNLMAIWPNVAKGLNINPNIENLVRVYISNEDEIGWCFNI